jgi:hypothetical protein
MATQSNDRIEAGLDLVEFEQRQVDLLANACLGLKALSNYVAKHHLVLSPAHSHFVDEIDLVECVSCFFCIPRDPGFLEYGMAVKSTGELELDPYYPGKTCPNGLQHAKQVLAILIMRDPVGEYRMPGKRREALALCMEETCKATYHITPNACRLVRFTDPQ